MSEWFRFVHLQFCGALWWLGLARLRRIFRSASKFLPVFTLLYSHNFLFLLDLIGSQVKTSDLRSQSRTELKSALEQQKQQLASLKIAKVTGGAPNKIARIKSVRLAIARILTVIRQNQLKSLREAYSGAKYTPLDLRAKKTRAIRRRLSPAEKNAKTAKQAKKDAYYPKRKYALKA